MEIMSAIIAIAILYLMWLGVSALTDFIQGCIPQGRTWENRMRENINKKFTPENRAAARKFYGCQFEDEKDKN